MTAPLHHPISIPPQVAPWMSLVNRSARRFCHHEPWLLPDYMQEGIIGVWTALRTYDPGKGAKLASWVYRRVMEGMWHFCRDCSSQIRVPGGKREKGILPPLVYGFNARGREQIALAADWTSRLDDRIDAERLLHDLLSRLPPRQREAVVRRLRGLPLSNADHRNLREVRRKKSQLVGQELVSCHR